MNFSPSSTSLPRLSKDGLRIQPATEILSPAPRRSQPQRPQGQRVQGQRPQSQRPQGQRTTVHRNQGNGTASRNPGAARPAANQNSYNAQSSRASATNMRSGNARRSANPRQGASHNGRDKITNNPHVRNAQHKLEAIEKKQVSASMEAAVRENRCHLRAPGKRSLNWDLPQY